ncbi:MAG TPA: alpha/beta hydrolase [Micromonosporaceae bacterium]|jgi:hypothetical protein
MTNSERDADRAALIAPGRGYGPDAPLLDYAGRAADNRGATVEAVAWESADEIAAMSADDDSKAICAQVAARLEAIPAARPLLIGKSLGSHAASVAADRDLPAVWITPLLHREWVIDGMRAATQPFLLIGGTADRTWFGDVARSLSPYVLEIDGANHGMFVPGRLADSAAVLGRVATAVEDFLDQVVWPVR